MKQLAILLCTGLLALPLSAMAQECAARGVTEVTITRAGDGALARYQFGEAIACLKLGDRGEVRKLTWQLLTEGARLSEDGNTVHLATPRADFSVRLNAFEKDGVLDRVYSPVIAFGDGSAVAVYSGYLRPAKARDGFFMVFDGFAPSAAERDVGPQRIGNERTYMIVGKPSVQRRGAIAAVIDQAMPAWFLSKVSASIAQGETALRGFSAEPRPLAYLMTFTKPNMAETSWRGDVLDRLVRLNFSGVGWRYEPKELHGQADHFILHELFHTVSADAIDSQLPGSLSLLEGGAEAGAIALRRRLDPQAGAVLSAAVDYSIKRCQSLLGNTLAEKETKSLRDAPYACGLAMQSLAAAASGKDPLDIWQAMLRTTKPYSAGWPDFLKTAAGLGTPNKPAMAVLDDIAASRTDWETGLARLADSGALRRRSEAEAATPGSTPVYRSAAIFHVLGENCSGQFGFKDVEWVHVLDAPAQTCQGIPDKFGLVAMNGYRLGDQAAKAHKELIRRCAAGAAIELLDDKGRKIELACKAAPKEVVFYKL